MFKGCTSLKYSPELPATTLADKCYQSMFEDCFALEDILYIGAKDSKNQSFDAMFKNCPKIKISKTKNSTLKYPFVVYVDMKNIFGDSGVNGLKDLLKDVVYYKATKFGDQNYDPLSCVKDRESKRIITQYNIPVIPGTSVPDHRNPKSYGNFLSYTQGKIEDKFPTYSMTEGPYYPGDYGSITANYNGKKQTDYFIKNPVPIIAVRYIEITETRDSICSKVIYDYYRASDFSYHSTEMNSSIAFK